MRIHSVKILTKQLAEAKTFYVEVLGFPLVENNNNISFTVKVGRSYLIFEQTNNIDEEPFYHFAFDIPENKLKESIAWLEVVGITLTLLSNNSYTVYSKAWNATSIYFYDSVGNIVEFIARHNLDNAIHTRFTGDEVLNISEIGLVVHDVTYIKTLLSTKITEYKDSNHSFAAIGDEEGLFILSADKRVWFGSDKAANIYRTEMTVTVEGINKGTFIIDEYPYKIDFKE